MAHHLLTTYLKSYIAVIKTQFSTKAFQGGREVWFCHRLECAISACHHDCVLPQSDVGNIRRFRVKAVAQAGLNAQDRAAGNGLTQAVRDACNSSVAGSHFNA